MKLLTITRVLGLSLVFLATHGALAQTVSQWNVNNNGAWYNSLNWLGFNPANGVGTTAVINQDFNPARSIGDLTQTATMLTTAGTNQQAPVTLDFTPLNNTIGVTDGTLFWSQGRGSNSTAWTVVYDSINNQIKVTYNPAITGNRTLTISYATPTIRPSNDIVGVAEYMTSTDGVNLSFSKVLTAQVPNPAAIAVTDGTHWVNLVTGASSNPNVTGSYNPGTRTVTINYGQINFAPQGRRIYAAYAPFGMTGTVGVTVGTTASNQAIRFTRQMATAPTLASSFTIGDSNYLASSNGAGVFTSTNADDYTVTYNSGTRTAVVTYRNANALSSIDTFRTLTANYLPSSPTANQVTLGNLHIGDISGGERIDIRTNQITFDNAGQQSQINKIVGGADEIASPIVLNNNLSLAVRTGGDAINNNSFYISGDISGNASLTKMDTGNLVLGGNNTYTGSTTIRTTGGFTFLKSAGTAIPSSDVFLGNASRDGNASFVLQYGINSTATLGTATTTNTNQIADNAVLWFDAASSRNSYIRMMGTGETVAGISDSTGNGVIENTETENGVVANSMLTLNSNSNYDYNGYLRNKSSGASSGTIGVIKEGSGTQTLAGGNIHYTGPTTIGGGTLRLLNLTNGSGNLPFNPQSTVNGATGGTFNSSNAPRFDSLVTNNSNLELAATTVWTYGKPIQGPGTVTKTGASNVNLTGASTYTGATNINEGTLVLTSGVREFIKNGNNDFVTAADNNGTLAASQRQQAIYGHGTLLNTSAINLTGTGNVSTATTLLIQNAQDRSYRLPGGTTTTTLSFNSNNRISDTAPINSDGGVINFSHVHDTTVAKSNYTETLGTLNLTGGRTVVTTSQAAEAATSRLILSGLNRVAGVGAVVTFTGTELGDNSRNTIGLNAPVLTNGILGGWAFTTGLHTANNFEVNFATWDNGTNSIRALQSYLAVTDLDTGNVTAASNVSLGGTETLTTSKSINSLKMSGGRTLNMGLSTQNASLWKTLTLESGGLIVTTGNGVINLGNLTAGAAAGYELNVYIQPDRLLTMDTGRFVNNGLNAVKLVKSGQGLLRLGATNSHSGGTIINEGNIEIRSDTALGATPSFYKSDFVTMNGGIISTAASSSSYDITFDPFKGITLGTGGGGFQADEGVVITIKSRMTGPGGFAMNPTGNFDGGSSGGTVELLGDNDFQGALMINFGEVALGGYESGIKKGTNTFKGPITVSGGILSVKNSAAMPASRPSLTMTAGAFNLYDDATIGALSSAGMGNSPPTISSAYTTTSGYVLKPVTLTIYQDTNTTYSGSITNARQPGTPSGTPEPALSIDKRGKGTLTLGNTDNNYDGITKVSEGTLLVSAVGLRGNGQSDFNSIGTGQYDASVADGTGNLGRDKKSASNLVIADGAAFGTVGEFQMVTDRPFTIGVGQQGATLLANSPRIGDIVAWRQAKLYQPGGGSVWTGEYDDIQFSEDNKNALLILGGRNQGKNQFGMDLHDNGTGKLSLEKSGDGQWIMGEWGKTSGDLITTPSRNDFTGRTTIYLGTLGIAQDHVLGNAFGESVNLVGGNLDLINVDYTTHEDLSLSGGRLRAFIGNSAWTGNIGVNVSSVIEIGAGASIKLRGNASGKGGITKVGFGTLTLEGTNTFTGGFTVQEGTLQLDYTNNQGSKLADAAGFVLGGGRAGATLDIKGGTDITPIVETVAALNLGLGQSRITRSDETSTTVILLNQLQNARVAQGSALDIGANDIVRTDRLNDPAGGLLGTWLTVNQRDWATNATNAVDGSIVALTNYTADNWSGAATNTTVTLANNTVNSAVTNTLRYNAPLDTVLTLTGINTIRSGGILQTADVDSNNNIITGGTIAIQDNGFGGNMMIHQNNPKGSLTIDSALTNASLPSAVSGDMYVSSLANRMNVVPASAAAKLVPGMLITGANIEPNTVIDTIDYTTGALTFNQGRTAETDIVLTIAGSDTFTGDTMVQGVGNRVRVKTGNLASLATGQTISGNGIPPGATISSVGVDFTNNAYRILTINQTVQVPPVISSFTITPIQYVTGQVYFNNQINRFRISPITGMANVYLGMSVTGDQIEPNTVVSAMDPFNGDIYFSNGRNAGVGLTITIAGNANFTGDTMVGNAQNRVRVTGTSAHLLAIAVGNSISGGTIPANTTVTGITLDNIFTPTVATLTISQNIPLPALLTNYTVTLGSRNGLAKYGSGTLVLGGESTYTGATYITGGKVNVKKLTNGGIASPIGAASSAANNIVLSGGTLGYIGDSVTTDRGFQINEAGGVEVARKGAVATFNGNLSGGVGGAAGVLQKSGQGTLNIARIGGSVIPGSVVGSGGATNIGGMQVTSGTLQLTYNNPNSNENSNRFSATNATLTLGGGKLELVGLDDVPLPEGTASNIANPSENRTQLMQGVLTLEAGGSEIWVTSGKDTTTLLELQNPADAREVNRKAGGTVLLVENPNGGTANMTLAIPASVANGVIPYATYWDTSQTNVRGVNHFAAVEASNNHVITPDDKNLYRVRPELSTWENGLTISEGAGKAGFEGFTPTLNTSIFVLRFRAETDSTVNITQSLNLGGGAILVGGAIGDFTKKIEGGTLTSSYHSGSSGINPLDVNPAGIDFGKWIDQEIVQYDLMIHNYNQGTSLEIGSTIQDTKIRGLVLNGGSFEEYAEPVNLVHTGIGTTMITGTNTYSGRTLLTGGVLRLGPTSFGAIPGGIGTTGGTSNLTLKGGMLGLNGDFLRPLGTTGSDVQFTGSGGFAAYGGTRNVNFGGAGDEVAWGVNGFVPGGEALLLNSYDADGLVRFVNPIDLGSGYRQIEVGDSSVAVDAELAGGIKGNGGIIAKVGQGTLRMTANNTYTGGTDLAQGRLIMQGSQASPLTVSAVDATGIGDAVALQLDGANINSSIAFGNRNSQGITTLEVTNNSIIAGAMSILRDVFLDVTTGKSVTISGAVTGSGRLVINEGGAVTFNGTGNFGGTNGGIQGRDINGGVVIRNGTVNIGTNGAVGTTNIELGDAAPSATVSLVDRSTNGRSLLYRTGVFYPTSSGTRDSVNGYGAFVFENQGTLTIDGQVYDQFSVGKRILVDGEVDNPERNGVYEIAYFFRDLDGDATNTPVITDDIISLVRVSFLREADQQKYGLRVKVVTGSVAGKTYFLATDVPSPLPPVNGAGHMIISTALLWKEETSSNVNVNLLVTAAGLNVTNTIDVNDTNESGTTTIGGASTLISGSSTFSGQIKLQDIREEESELHELRLTSETKTGHGIEFSGVISEAASEDYLSIRKIGSGTATLTALNTYKGDTHVTAGTLLVNGGTLNDAIDNLGSGTGFGDVFVSNFGTILGGTGAILGRTTIGEGAFLSPGDPVQESGIGTLNFAGDLSLGAGSTTEFHLASELSFDKLVISGLLTIDPAALLSVFLDFDPDYAMDFQLMNWSNLASDAGNLADRLDLPAIASDLFYWDTSFFNSIGVISYAERQVTTPPPVHFAAKEVRMAEDGGSFTIALELDWAPDGGVSVPLQFSGTATHGVDYTVSESPVLFAGTRSKTITITINNDSLAEGTEKGVITIGTPTGALLGTPATLNLTIADNDNGFASGDQWDLRNPLPTNETLTGTAYIGTNYVAVGTKGTLLSSPDGTTWTRSNNASSLAMRAVTSSDTIAVAVGDKGQILTSTNGLTWTIRSAAGGKDLKGVVWDGSTFIAVGSSRVVYYSTDGISWSIVDTPDTPTPYDLLAVAASPTRIVAVGSAGTIISSSDGGFTWEMEASGIATALRGVAHNGASLFVASGDAGVILTSPDGDFWTPRTSGIASQLNSITWDGAQFLTAGTLGVVRSSANGITWAAQTSTVTIDLENVAKVNTLWFGTGESGTILSSTNGTTWARTSSSPDHTNYGVTVAGTTAIAVGEDGKILTSADGATWVARTSPVATRLNSVVGTATNIVAVGHAGAAIHSTDGIAWTSAPTGTAQNLYAVARMGTRFCAVGDNGTIYTSDNGTTWTNRTGSSSTEQNLRGIAATADKFVAVGTGGTVITSPDGIAWSLQSLGSSANLRDVTWTNSVVVAVGEGGTIFSSANGIDWAAASVLTSSHLNGVVGVGTEVIAVGDSGVALVSVDSGLTWARRETGTSQNFRSLAVNAAQRYIGVGINGTIMTTDKIVKPSPKVSFTLASQTVSEAAGLVNVQVNVSPAATSLVTVPFSVSLTSTAKAPGDYTIVATALKFAPGETTKNIPITVKSDAVQEATETVIINLGTPSGGTTDTASPTEYILSITDEFGPPAIGNVTADSQFVIAGTQLRVSATATGSNPLKIQWLRGTTKLGTPVVVNSGIESSYIVPAALIANGGKYGAVASNPLKTAGNASTGPVEVVVVEQLPQQLVLGKENTALSLTANAGGNGLKYSWYRDGTPLQLSDVNFSGVATKKLTIKKMSLALEGVYKCLVTSTVATPGSLFSTEFQTRKATLPVITSGATLALPAARVGTLYNVVGMSDGFQVPYNNDAEGRMTPTSWTAATLPKGLTINSAGIIRGTPIVGQTAPVTYTNIKITATNAAGKSTITIATITVNPIDSKALGSFVGLVERSGDGSLLEGNHGLGAKLELTTNNTSVFSGKVIIGATSYPFTAGSLNTATPAAPTGVITVARKGKPSMLLSFTIDTTTQLISGTLADTTTTANFSGWRQTWTTATAKPVPNPATAYLGRHNFAATIPVALEGDSTENGQHIPQGDSYGSATVAVNGVVTVVYRTADNPVASTLTVPLGPTGQFLIYKSLYVATAPGSVTGILDIGEVVNVREVTGNLTWRKYTQLPTVKPPLYLAGFGPITLDVTGGFYTPPTIKNTHVFMDAALTAPGVDNASLSFFSVEGLMLSPTAVNPNLAAFRIESLATYKAPLNNPGTVTLTMNAGTGEFSGQYVLNDLPAAKRTVKYYGMVIPDVSTAGTFRDGVGVGYYILPGTTATLPQKSGRVTMLPLP